MPAAVLPSNLISTYHRVSNDAGHCALPATPIAYYTTNETGVPWVIEDSRVSRSELEARLGQAYVRGQPAVPKLAVAHVVAQVGDSLREVGEAELPHNLSLTACRVAARACPRQVCASRESRSQGARAVSTASSTALRCHGLGPTCCIEEGEAEGERERDTALPAMASSSSASSSATSPIDRAKAADARVLRKEEDSFRRGDNQLYIEEFRAYMERKQQAKVQEAVHGIPLNVADVARAIHSLGGYDVVESGHGNARDNWLPVLKKVGLLEAVRKKQGQALSPSQEARVARMFRRLGAWLRDFETSGSNTVDLTGAVEGAMVGGAQGSSGDGVVDDVQGQLEALRDQLSAEHAELSKYLQHANRGHLHELTRRSVELINDAQLALNHAIDDSSWSGRQALVFLGHNGMGKSFLINLLLMIGETASYGTDEASSGAREGEVDAMKALASKKKASDPALPPGEDVYHDDDAGDVGDNDDDDPSGAYEEDTRNEAETTVDELDNAPEATLPALLLVRPPNGVFDSSGRLVNQGDVDREQRALEVIRGYAGEGGFASWDDFLSDNGKMPPTFLLPSGKRGQGSSTTPLSTKLRFGETWHFTVVYKTARELYLEFAQHDFKRCSSEKGAMEKAEVADHEARRKRFLAVVKGQTPAESSSASNSVTRREAKRRAEDEILRLWPPFVDNDSAVTDDMVQEQLVAHLEPQVVSRLGKTLVYIAPGKSSVNDRIFIRDALRDVLLPGIAGGGRGGGSSNPNLYNPAAFVIDDLTVYAPCELLRGKVDWIDAPGTDDVEPLKAASLVTSLEEADGVVMLTERTIIEASGVAKAFSRYVAGRFFEHKMGFFRLSKRSRASWPTHGQRSQGLARR